MASNKFYAMVTSVFMPEWWLLIIIDQQIFFEYVAILAGKLQIFLTPQEVKKESSRGVL